MRPRTIAALLLSSAAAVQAQNRPTLTATFIGNMAVHLTDGETALVTDFPYQSGYSVYMTWTKNLVPAGPKPLCLITHSHRDHFAQELSLEYCARLLGPASATTGFGGEIVPMADSVTTHGISVKAIRTRHANLEHYSYRVSFSGRELYFTGDTEDETALLEQKGLDVAFVSPWLLDSVLKRGARVDAKQVVVYHHQKETDGETTYGGARVPKQGEKLKLP